MRWFGLQDVTSVSVDAEHGQDVAAASSRACHAIAATTGL
jgi:hypothetical protein